MVDLNPTYYTTTTCGFNEIYAKTDEFVNFRLNMFNNAASEGEAACIYYNIAERIPLLLLAHFRQLVPARLQLNV